MYNHGTVASIAVAGLLVFTSAIVGFDAPWSPGAAIASNQRFPPLTEPLQIKAEYKVEQEDTQQIREHVEIRALFTGVDPIDPESGRPVENIKLSFGTIEWGYAEVFGVDATFASSELQPDPSIPALEDLALGFEANFPGANALSPLRIVIPSDIWSAGDGGGFKIAELAVQHPETRVLVVQNGQVVADLTQQVAAFAGTLRPDPGTKTWELQMEIDGIIIPTDVHVPLFARAGGARIATVIIGNGLEQRFAAMRNAEAIF